MEWSLTRQKIVRSLTPLFSPSVHLICSSHVSNCHLSCFSEAILFVHVTRSSTYNTTSLGEWSPFAFSCLGRANVALLHRSIDLLVVGPSSVVGMHRHLERGHTAAGSSNLDSTKKPNNTHIPVSNRSHHSRNLREEAKTSPCIQLHHSTNCMLRQTKTNAMQKTC